MTTIIEIASIRPPKEGKKVATVVAEDGRSFEMWPERMTGLQIGARYEIEIKEREWNSRTIRQIVKAKPAEVAANGNAKTIATTTSDAELAFVSSTLNAFIAAGHVKPEAGELSRTTTLLRMLWSHTFGDAGTSRANEAMNRTGTARG